MKWRDVTFTGLESAMDAEDQTLHVYYPSWFQRLVRRFK